MKLDNRISFENLGLRCYSNIAEINGGNLCQYQNISK